MRIRDLLKEDRIIIGGTPASKDEVIDQLADLMAGSGVISDAGAYKEAVHARENECSTAVGEGIAIPHAKSDAVIAPGLAAMTVPGGISFDSSDGKLSDLIFLIAAPNTEDNSHLRILARLSTLLMNKAFTGALRAAKTGEAFLKVFDDFETAGFAGEETGTAKKAPPKAQTSRWPDLLAITACPTGIAHTYMAAEALEKKAKELGFILKAETQGTGGAKNVITRAEVRHARGLIVAADKTIDLERFAGIPVCQTSVSEGIHEPEALINKIIKGEAPVYKGPGAAGDSRGKSSRWRILFKKWNDSISRLFQKD